MKSIGISIFLISVLFMTFSCAEKKEINISLKDTFKNHYMIGVAANHAQISGSDSQAEKLIVSQFNTITPENMLKWEKVHPDEGVYNFEPVDDFVAFGETHEMFIVGHTLIWHNQTPDWVFQDSRGKEVSREILLERMKTHISTVVGKYKGRIHGWDVVNESFEDNGEMRITKWMQIIGEDYIQKAFEFAHQADPDAELYYNDFNMWYPGKIESVKKLVNDLESKGIKIDGIGLQGHWGLDYPSNEEIDFALGEYSKLNVNLMITELDMAVLPMVSGETGAEITRNYELRKEYDPYTEGFPDSMQIKLADRYEDFFNYFNKYNKSISRVTFWAVNDGYSWRNYWPVRGRKSYPMLFDRDFQPKPAFYSVINTVKQ